MGTWDVQNGFQCVVAEFDLVIGTVGGIADGIQALLANGQQLGAHSGLAVEPEVLRVTIAVVHGQVGEILGLDAVDDGIMVLLLHQNLVHFQDEVGSELGGDAVEVVVGRLIAIETAGGVVLGVVQFPDPGAFDDLDSIGQDHGGAHPLPDPFPA